MNFLCYRFMFQTKYICHFCQFSANLDVPVIMLEKHFRETEGFGDHEM